VVSAAGDVNGDGYGDLLIGGKFADAAGADSGAAYVVFGRASGFTSTLQLATLNGANGFRMSGVAQSDQAGYSVAAAGDVNGDGYEDVIIGAPQASFGGVQAGAAYIVFGSGSGFAANLDISSLDGTNGFVIRGAAAGDLSGYSVSGAGDLNGDGFDDVIVGSFADANGDASGAGYVLYGGNFNGAANFVGGAGADSLTGTSSGEAFVGGAGADTLTGGGGSDAFSGGAGNDRIVLGTGTSLRVDGGSGTDTVAADALGGFLGGTQLSRWTDIEKIDLGGTRSNLLMLEHEAVANLSDTSNTLLLKGDVGDQVFLLHAGWARGADVLNPQGETGAYRVYTSGAVSVLVESDLTVRGSNLTLLDGSTGYTLAGELAGDRAGTSVSAAGDVNGDGYGDVVIGAIFADPGGQNSGAAYLVFGKASGFSASESLASLNGSTGFQLSGSAASDVVGMTVSTAGDVNGDGYADFIVGRNPSVNAPIDPGSAYVVFGKPSGFVPDLNVSSLNGSNGFKLSGVAAADVTGRSVSDAGDVNGDGYDDLIVGADFADPHGTNSGAAYVVFGHGGAFSANLGLATLNGANGFKLSGLDAGDRTGNAVSAAGDFNGDGIDDIVIGARDSGNLLAGSAFVVFGTTAGFPANIDLSSLNGANGFRLMGASGDRMGYSVSDAGDVNGDGFGDVIVGSFFPNPGASYVVFGRASGTPASLVLSTLDGSNGFKLSGEFSSDGAGFSVSGAGDINGDGFDDLLVGAQNAFGTEPYAGRTYVVFGKASGFAANIALSSLDGTNGFALVGDGYDRSGYSVATAGDVNGDGFDDLITSASLAPGGNAFGESHVFFGGNFTGAVTHQGGAGADALAGTAAAEMLIGGQGDDILAGGGGADVLRGGAGSDRLEVSSTGFADVDGGSGTDTLALAGAGLTLDLTALGATELEGVEIIDLTGSGNNALKLALRDVLGLSDTTNALTVNGNGGDSVMVTDGSWTDGGIQGVYHVYTLGVATLRIDTEIASVTIAT
jgi:hypothetical protein